LSVTDSTIAKGWMQNSNFDKSGKDPIQASVRADAARHHAKLFMDANIKGYSQWFVGKPNNAADALSRHWNRDDNKLTSILCLHFPQQMPTHFETSPLPSKISSWLILLLQRLPANKQLREEHTTTNLALGADGRNIASQLDVKTSSWTASPSKSKFSCLDPLLWLSEADNSQTKNMEHWLRPQSEVPSQMWYRPSSRQGNRIQLKMQTTSLASFYRDNLGHSEMTIPKKNNKRPSPFPCLTN
jgi:hypothetical protein